MSERTLVDKRQSRARFRPHELFLYAGSLLLPLAPRPARAVIVRGTVRDGMGRPVANARIQLIFGTKTATYTLSGNDGSFELRDGDSGRFVLLTAAATFAPQIGQDFYGGQTAVVYRDVTLSASEVRTSLSVIANATPTPLPQVTAAVSLIDRDALTTRVGIAEELRLQPGTFVVQQGQAGGVTTIFLRGGGSDANRVTLDGQPITDVGGAFDLSTVSSTGLSIPGASQGVETYRGANSAVDGTDALAGAIALRTARGEEARPVLIYSGDAGNLHTWRNEGLLSGTFRRFDFFVGLSRFDTSNALPQDRFHDVTSVGNIGYSLTANTALRLTIRNSDAAVGLPDAYDFHHLVAQGKQADQDLYGDALLQSQTTRRWQNILRYGLSRKREEAQSFGAVGEPVLTVGGPTPYLTYYGLASEIRGANGFSTSGQAAFYPATEQSASNRDELEAKTGYILPGGIMLDAGFRFDDERGLYAAPAQRQTIDRTNYEYSFGVHGDAFGRLAYSAAGAIEDNALFGVKGTPRFGLAYQLVRPGRRLLQGTRFRGNVATGVQEPSLALEYASLYRQLLAAGKSAAIAQYNIGPVTALRSRTLDIGLDQNIAGERLTLHVAVFHNQFSHQFDFVDAGTLQARFGIDASSNGIYGAELNSLSYRAQGIEGELDFQLTPRTLFRAGYTFLETRVEQSFATDAIAAVDGRPTTNPLFPDIAIGATSPLVGGRVFRRPPHTAFAVAQYTGRRITAAAKAGAGSRADDSTFLSYADRNGGNSLLLPNRNLDFSFVKVDVSLAYLASKKVTLFTQLENLANDQHIGPIGYPGLPLTVRAGLKLRLGGS